MVPFPAGGGVDLVARTLGEKLSSRLVQSIVIENRPGAGTAIGTEIVVKSPADGYTWLVSPVGGHGVLHAMKAKLPFDARKDLSPAGRIAYGTIALIVPASSKAKTVQDLVAMAKASPGKMTYASSGTGASTHLIVEWFNSVAGVQITHVPYKGSSAAITDVISGQVTYTLETAAATMARDCTGGALSLDELTCTLTMSTGRIASVTFKQVFAIEVAPVANGTVTSTSDQVVGSQLNCSADLAVGDRVCTAYFDTGANVTLTAKPTTKTAYRFKAWTDDLCKTNTYVDNADRKGTCTISNLGADYTGDAKVTPTYQAIFALNFTVTGEIGRAHF